MVGLFTGRLSWRKLKVLLYHLPSDAVTVRAQSGLEADWSYEHELLAIVADRVAELTWLTVEIHKKEGADNPTPEPIARPGQPSRQSREALHKSHRRHSSISDMKRFFGTPAGR